MDTTTEPERASAASPKPIPPELQAKMVTALERARAERLSVRLPEDRAHSAGDPRTQSNTAAWSNAAALLVLERECRVVAARLSRPNRRRRNRYRDLIVVTKLLQVEYEHLSGRAVESAESPSQSSRDTGGGTPADSSPSNGNASGGGTPADWARPWGPGPLIELSTALSFYQDQRDQLGGRLPILSRGTAAAAAGRHLDRVLSRFEMAKGGRVEQEALSAPPSERAWPWTSPRFMRSAAAVACGCAAIGIGAILVGTRGDGSGDLGGNPTPVVASVPDALLAVGERPQARGRGDESRGPRRDRGNVGAEQASISAPEVSVAPAPAPVPEPAPAPVAPAPVAAPAPPPPPPPPAPEPNPQPNPTPRPGPVSPLPPPVDTLPPPARSGSRG